MDVNTNLISQIHKKHERRNHETAISDQPTSPIDFASYDLNPAEDASLLVIPDTPSPIFNGRKIKIKLTGKFTSSNGSSISPEFAARNIKCDAGVEGSEQRHSTTVAGHTGSCSKRLMEVIESSDHKSPLCDIKKQHLSVNTNYQLSMEDAAGDVSAETDHHHQGSQLEGASPKTREFTYRFKKRRSQESSVADIDDLARKIDYRNGNIRLNSVSPQKVESTFGLKKRRTHKKGITSESSRLKLSTAVTGKSCSEHYQKNQTSHNVVARKDNQANGTRTMSDKDLGNIRHEHASPVEEGSTFRLKKLGFFENDMISETIDITDCNELVNSDSVDAYSIEDTNDVILSSEKANPLMGAICGVESPESKSGSNHSVSHKHSPKKRLFQNATRKRELLETDKLCSAIISQSESSDDKHRLLLKSRTTGESSPLKRCINVDRHSKSSRLKTFLASSYRHGSHVEVLPSSMPFTSPLPSSCNQSLLHRRHHRSHRKRQVSNTRTSSASSDWDSMMAGKGNADHHLCKERQHATRDTNEVASFSSFVPASCLIDLTETSGHPQNDKMSLERSVASRDTRDLAATRRHRRSLRHDSRRENRNSDGSDARMACVLTQLEQDEAMARRLQEEIDREIALTLVESENQVSTDSLSSFLQRDLGDLDQALKDIEMCTTTVNDYGPIQVQSRGARTCFNVADSGAVVSINLSANTRYPRRGRRRGGRHRHRGMEYYELEQNDGNDYEILLGLAEQLGDVATSVGLCRQHIDLLPQRLYSGPQTGRDSSCNICMCDYEVGDNLRMLPCFHEFHQPCIDKWIQKNATCPICRVDIEVGQS